MAKRQAKTAFKRALAVLSSAAVLLSCGTTGLFTADAAVSENDTAVKTTTENQAATKIKLYDENGNELNTITDPTNPSISTPIIYLDNKPNAGGAWYRNITVKTEGGSGDVIKYQTEAQPVSGKHIDVGASYAIKDDGEDETELDFSELNLTIAAAEEKISANGDVTYNSYKPGTTHIYLSTAEGKIYTTLTVVVYSPATDMELYWGSRNVKLGVNDYNIDNDIDLIAVANHQYQIFADFKPTDSTDQVEWAVYEGDFNSTELNEGYVPQPTNKAEISSNGFLTTKENGTVTVVVKPKATETSSRDYSVGEKKRYVIDENGNVKTISKPYVQTLPKFIHVTIAKENPAAKLEIANKDRASAMQVDETLQLELKATPTYTDSDSQTGATDVFTWVSSNPSVATVDEKGFVTAVSKGKVKISVYGEKENVYAECDIEVFTPAQAITFDKSEGTARTARIDVPIEITANLTPAESNERIVWDVEDPGIATIEPIYEFEPTNSQRAVLTGHAVGKTYVIAKTVDLETGRDKVVAKLLVDVKEKTLSGNITVDRVEGSDRLAVAEESTQFLYTQKQMTFSSSLKSITGEQADDTTVWEISNNDDDNQKIQIDSQNGNELIVHGLAEGLVTITAHSKTKPEISISFDVQVLKSCDKITLVNSEGNVISQEKPLNIGKTFDITAVLTVDGNTPTNHSDKVKSWESSNTDVAIVDDYGTVRGLAIGKSTITVTTASGLKKSATVSVFSPSSINIVNSKIVPAASSEEMPLLKMNLNNQGTATDTLKVTIKDSYGKAVNNTVDCEWTSSNEDVATISKNGVITAITTGTTIITARSGNTDKTDQVLVNVMAPMSLIECNDFVQYVYSPVVESYNPIPIVYMGTKLLTEGVDYTYSYENNTKLGTAYVILEGMGLYTGTKKIPFYIVARDLTDPTIEVAPIETQACTGKAITPELEISCMGVPLVVNKDYTLSYSNNTKPGVDTATVTVKGKGNYSGSFIKTFSIFCEHEELTNTTIIKEPTHLELGTLQGKCKNCGEIVQKEIPLVTVIGICGDLDGDGTPSAADALKILRYSVALEDFTKDEQYLADADNSGVVDSSDSLIVLRYSVGYVDNDIVGNEK